MRSKITLIMAVVLLIYFSFFVVLQKFAIAPRFAKLERAEATSSMDRCLAALHNEIEVLDRMVFDWAVWDDAYDFAADHNHEFIETNLKELTMIQNDISLICFLDSERRPIWYRYLDLETQKPLPTPFIPEGTWPQSHPLLGPPDPTMVTKGVMVLDRQPTLIVTRPILTSATQGPLHGYLVMGRPLGAKALERMTRQTQARLAIWELGAAPGLEQDPALVQLTPDSPYLIRELGHTSLHIFTVFRDLTRKPALLLRSEVSRDISSNARSVARFTLTSVLIAGLALLGILYLVMRLTLVQPMVAFAAQVAESRSATELRDRYLNRRDELGVIAQSFATLMQELAEDKKQLAQRSYRSGKAEMAGSILHNIRNGLHPVAAFLDMLLSDLRDAPLEDLRRAREELARADLEPERRAQLEEFVQLSHGELIKLIDEAELTLTKVLQQTKEVIKTTHSHKQGYVDSLAARVELGELVADAIKPISAQHGRALNVRVHDSVAHFGPIHTDAMAVVQILTNLMLYESGPRHGGQGVEVRAQREPVEGIGGLRLEICHPGTFLESVTLERLFERGYTWVSMIPDQGLHWCANKVNGLGGSLRASHTHEGLSFHLWLPLKEGVGAKA